MRARLLAAIAQPFVDLETTALKFKRFQRPVALLNAAQARAQQLDDALEALSFGLALAQVYVEARETGAREPEDEEEGKP
jgi:flagellar biosynthesis regulator FlaF